MSCNIFAKYKKVNLHNSLHLQISSSNKTIVEQEAKTDGTGAVFLRMVLKT
jgi:hypothetical protein